MVDDTLRVGVVLPQSEIGGDPADLRRYAEAVESYGYTHLMAYDHVLGADPAVHEGWSGPYDFDTMFHEPLVTFGFLAAITSLDLVTAVIIGPQRQTALLAKQAVQVDVLCEGRFRLGLGVGWNPVEYDALGQDFATRGRRLDEQIELLRLLWSNRSVTFDGQQERVVGAGLLPMPVQPRLPLWLGGSSAPAYRRIGREADGWFPQVPPGRHLDEALTVVAEGAAAAGRDPAAIAFEGRVSWGAGGLERVVDHVGRWREAGASHVAVNTMGAGFAELDQHLSALAAVAGALDLAG